MLKFCRKFSQGLLAGLIETYKEVNDSSPNEAILHYLVYLSREAGVPWNYSFDLLYYGPYSKELSYDLELLQADEVIELHKGFEKSRNYSLLVEEFKNEIEKNNSCILKILEVFKGMDINTLLLISSVYYIYSSRKLKENGSFKEKEVIKEIISLKKDQFDKKEVERSVFSLRQAALI